MNMALLVSLAGGIGFLVTLCAIPFAKRLAGRFDIVSYPGGHSCHSRPVPLLGGGAMLAGVVAAWLFFFVAIALHPGAEQHPGMRQMISLMLGSLWICGLGTLDDKRHLGWRNKLLGELVGVAILIAGGHTITVATIPFVGVVHFGWLGVPIFALTILTITNAVNLIDGIDGLAGGICFFAALVTGIIGLVKGDLFAVATGFGVAGTILAFLVYNFPPASIFMGDGGSLLLGFLLGAMASSSAATTSGQRSGALVMLLAPFLPFGIALLDVVLAIARRGLSGRRIFLPDTDHLHHRLMEAVGRPRGVVGILYAFSALLSALTLTLILGQRSTSSLVLLSLAGVLLIGLVVMVLRLYMRESLPSILENRPHMKFLASYMDYMSRRAGRCESAEELYTLLGSGVHDLAFDSVTLLRHGQVLRRWDRTEKTHPEAERHEEARQLGSELIVQAVIPQHCSLAYQKYLVLVWNQFLRAVECRLRELVDGVCTSADDPECPC
ncbi:glycosyltransferase family 4 protein [Megalodesulfovibrio paquesii]